MQFDPNKPSEDLPPLGEEKPVAPVAEAPAFDTNAPSEDLPQGDGNFFKTAAGLTAEIALPIAGAGLGTLLAGPAGTIGGGAAGGAIGNYIKQLLEIHSGERESLSGGQMVASAGVSAIPASLGVKTIAKATGLLKPAIFRSVQGAVTGVASEVAEKAIDEGRLPTWTEIGEKAIPAAALGGVLGAVEKRYATVGKLIANPVAAQAVQGATALGVTAYAWNDAVEKGDENALSKALLYGAAAYGATHIPSMLAGADKQSLVRKVMGPERILGKEPLEIIRGKEAEYKAAMDYATDMANNLSEAIKKHGLTSTSDLADLFSVLDGRANSSILSNEIRPFVNAFIEDRAKNTDKLIELFGGHIDDNLKEILRRNQTSYLRTAYAAHDPRAVKYVDYATPEATARFKDELIADFMAKDSSLTRQQAAASADVTMANMIDDVGYMFSAAFDGRKGTSPTSGFMKKGDLTDAAKEYLGVVKDPSSIIRGTLNTQAKLIFQESRDRELAVAMRNILSDQQLPGYIKVIAGDEPVLHRSFANKFAPKEFVEAYKEMVNPNLFGDGIIAKNYMALSGFAKAMKTVGNVFEAVMPQAVGNLAMAASAFKANPLELKNALFKAAQAHGVGVNGLSAEGRVNLARELRELRSLGVMSGGVDMNELTSLISQAAGNKGVFSGTPESVVKKLSKVYGFPDTAVRYSIYKQNLEEIRKFGVSYFQNENNLKKLAAEATNNQFPTYEKIPRRLRQLSAAGIANVFGGFEFEVMRNSVNQLKYATNLISEGRASGNQEMLKAGFKRLIGLTSVGAATAGLATMGSRMMGISGQDEKDLQMIVPPFDASKANIYALQGDGKFSYTPINYLMPYANMAATIGEAVTGGNPLPYAKSTLLGDDFGPMLTSGIEALTNTYYGTKVAITEPRDNQKLLERFAIRGFMPQAVTGTLARIEKAYRGETNKLGASPTFSDVGLRMAGYRQNTLDILGSAGVRIRDVSDPIAGELSGYHRILNQTIQRGDTNLSTIDENSIYNQRNFNYKQGQEKLAQIYQALSRLSKRTGDFGDKEIIETFKKAGVPSALIAGAVLNYTVDMPRGLTDSTTHIAEKIVAAEKRGENPYDMIKAEAAGDPARTKALSHAFLNIKKDEARGGDAVTKLFSGMGVASGDRANSIIKAMNSNPEIAENLLRKLVSTKVITPEVMRQMSEIQNSTR